MQYTHHITTSQAQTEAVSWQETRSVAGELKCLVERRHDVMVDDPPEKRRRGHDGVAAAETSGRPLPALPDELWCKILTDVHQNDVFAFASSCRQLRRAQVSCGRTLKTKMKQYLHSQERVGRFSVLWFEWHSRCTRVKTKEDMKARTMLINASAFLGHLEVRLSHKIARNQSRLSPLL